MKIVLLSPLPPPSGGIATWTVRYEQFCRAHDIPVHIVDNALVGARKDKRTSRFRIGEEIHRTAKIIWKLDRSLHDIKPDVLHLNSSCSRLGIYRDCLCVLMARLHGVPVIVQCHCNIPDQIRSAAAKIAFAFMTSMCRKVLVLNRFSAEYARRHAGSRVEIVPNFADETDIHVRTGVSDTIRKALFVGHVRREKGAEEIIRAARSLPEIRFELVGPIHQDIEALPRTENVVLSGPRTHEEVLQLLRDADVFLFPSYTEGFANALLEAMAAGLPVIATDVGANAEMIGGGGGIIIPKAHEQALRDAINVMSDDVDIRRKMAAWNVEKVRSSYLIELVMERVMSIYKEVIG